jgi:alpha-galactosidase
MKRACFVLAAQFLIALSICAAQPDLTGVWLLRIPNGDGTDHETFFQLNQQGTTLSGSTQFNYRRAKISQGTVADGKFRIVVGTGNRQTIYEGTVEQDKLAIEAKHSNGKVIGNGIAERSTESAMAPPKALPLPALHDLKDNGLARTPPMGWNSWNHFAGKVDDKTVRAIADAMATNGMKDAGYVYVNIDDTWQGKRDASGKMHANTKFPDMKALADYVHSKGLKIGIYSSPGPTTCAGYEGSLGHEKSDAETYAEWGIDYLKYDWCGAGAIYQDSDMQAAYQKMGEALLSTGRPIVYSLCQYGRNDVWTWGAKVSGNLWRTTGDISDHWDSLAKIGFKQLAIAPFATVGHWNDPDMLEIGNGGMSDDEYRTHMSMWAMLRAPLLAGNDVRDMSESTKSILLNRDVIAIDQDPRGEHARLAKTEGDVEVWTRPLAEGATAVAFFNKGEQTATVKLSWADLGVNTPKEARDLWSDKDVDASSASYAAQMPTHGTVLLRVQ